MNRPYDEMQPDGSTFESRLELFFDPDFYVECYDDIAVAGVDPKQHFLKLGWSENRRPNRWYSDKLVPKELIDRHRDTPPFIIFINNLPNITEDEFLLRCKSKDWIENGHDDCWHCEQMRMHFDGRYYRSKYFDISHEADALQHYCETGWKELRKPNKEFDPEFYIETYQDIREANINPFVHYLSRGKFEGRKPSPINPLKRKLLRSLLSITEENYQLKNAHPQLTFTPGSKLTQSLLSNADCKQGICIAFSHDNFLKQTGGVQKFVSDEGSSALNAGYKYLHIYPAIAGRTLLDDQSASTFLINCSLDKEFLGTFTALEISNSIEVLCAKFSDLNCVSVIHSLMGWSVSAVKEILSDRNIEVFLYGHDYFLLCPEYKLIRNNLVPCNAPPISSHQCNICIHQNERQKHLLALSKIYEVMSPKIIYPSATVKKIFENAWPTLNAPSTVLPHIKVTQIAPPHQGDEEGKHSNKRLKIAFCGEPVPHKGFMHFIELIESCRLNEKLDFFHFGKTKSSVTDLNFIKTSLKSGESLMINNLKNNDIDVVFIGSTWAETFNFVAYEAAEAGCAIITLSNSGNVADFVRTMAIGMVTDNLDSCVSVINSDEFYSFVNHWKANTSRLVFSKNQSIFSEGLIEK